MSKPYTHILIEFPSRDLTLLYRADDGMALGCRTGVDVMAGCDPNPAKLTNRKFLDVKFALAYLKRVADLDENAIDEDDRTPREKLARYATFDERFGESKIVHPPSQLGLKN